uniref:Uncharacterized protein n=1 Tax=Pogona vitticeps TaxID=103695 RepID=A0ABM5EPD2_9SAUR
MAEKTRLKLLRDLLMEPLQNCQVLLSIKSSGDEYQNGKRPPFDHWCLRWASRKENNFKKQRWETARDKLLRRRRKGTTIRMDRGVKRPPYDHWSPRWASRKENNFNKRRRETAREKLRCQRRKDLKDEGKCPLSPLTCKPHVLPLPNPNPALPPLSNPQTPLGPWSNSPHPHLLLPLPLFRLLPLLQEERHLPHLPAEGS